MIVGLFAIFQIIAIACFVWAFYSKNEIVWALTTFLSGLLAFASFDVQFSTYVFDPITQSYVATFITEKYIYLAGINILLFTLAVALGAYDLYEKISTGKRLDDMRQGN